jgi:hypothetical protein
MTLGGDRAGLPAKPNWLTEAARNKNPASRDSSSTTLCGLYAPASGLASRSCPTTRSRKRRSGAVVRRRGRPALTVFRLSEELNRRARQALATSRSTLSAEFLIARIEANAIFQIPPTVEFCAPRAHAAWLACYSPLLRASHGWHAVLRVVCDDARSHYFFVLSVLGCRIPPD